MPKDIFFLTGRSGGGKTQLLKTIALLTGLDEGKLRFQKSYPLLKPVKDIHFYRSQVHYVSQSATFYPGIVQHMFDRLLSLRVYRPRNINLNQVQKYLEYLDIPRDILQKQIADLSGGEKQALQLIRALVLRPKVFLLDEPTSAMDQNMRQKFFQLLINHIEKEEAAALIVTHNIVDILFGYPILWLKKGHIRTRKPVY